MNVREFDKHSQVFYSFWEKFVDSIPDDVLESTIFMIKNSNSLNELIKEEHGYRNCDELYIEKELP